MIYGQQEYIPEIEANFSALIVKDMGSSIQWYTEILGFKIIDKKEVVEFGLKQSNLKSGNTRLELIELESAVSPEKTIPNYNSKTRLVGLFKIGFLVSEFDKFMDHLQENHVKMHGDIVTDKESGKRMVIIKDPDDNRIQIFEN
jgi:catechol 2,3-dioxygenase-like lactoylglutathione lyase family enzyme